MAYIPHTDRDVQFMLEVIGAASVEELLESIPESIRLQRELNLPGALAEMDLQAHMAELAAKNESLEKVVSFIGGGAYDHYLPSGIRHLLLRSEFYTAYTPYQPEVSQGTLQAMYEFQTMICELTGLDIANASLYDGASALFEAVSMVRAATKRQRILVAATIHPHYLQTLRTLCYGLGVEIKVIPGRDGHVDLDLLHEEIDDRIAGVVIQHPNFYGHLERPQDVAPAIHRHGGLLVTSVDPISLPLLKPPGAYGADIAVGEGQGLGNGLAYGGPYLGFLAARREYLRRMPGRIVGQTRDLDGRRGFVLTLQTREQHIRREKATSNICTSQALNALAATIYMALLGKSGMRKVAELCLQKSHYAMDQITQIEGFRRAFPGPFFKEFTLRTPLAPQAIIHQLQRKKILPGLDLARFDPAFENHLLVAVTEQRTKMQIDRLVEELERIV